MRMNYFAALFIGAACLTAAPAIACSLEPTDLQRIKQMMAKEIAYKVGIAQQDVPLSKITEPQIHSPLGLGADCSGLGAYHYTSGFRIRLQSADPGPVPPVAEHVQKNAQYLCTYEGVAAVLGYDYSSPVAVNFIKNCDVE